MGYDVFTTSKMGIDVLDGFRPLYHEISAKAEVVARLKKKLKGCDELILATDEVCDGWVDRL
jgi:DNA topoisomerase-1